MGLYEKALDEILEEIPNPKLGLPEKVFEFASSIVPMVNVDLLIRNEKGEILLAWRDDKFAGPVWHIPGGIIRFGETMRERIQKVAMQEVGTAVDVLGDAACVREIFSEHRERGHFISFLYECAPLAGAVIATQEKERPQAGDLRWFGACPANFIECQRAAYQMYFNGQG